MNAFYLAEPHYGYVENKHITRMSDSFHSWKNSFYNGSLHQSTKQIASFLPIHIYQELLGNMLNHMQHFMAEAIHILRSRTGPSNHHHGFSHINVRIGYPFIRFTFEHEITGIFERNAAASQIPKIPSYLHGIIRMNIIHHMYRPVVPFQIYLLLSHSTNQ